jgi:hypothetical protein
VRRRFEEYLRALWAQWAQAHALSFPEQVVELFGRFCDDTVSLDAKTGRLPRFQTIRTQPVEPSGGRVYLIADGQGKRWCASVQSGPVDESAIAQFEAFCRDQSPKPSRKVVVLNTNMDETARLLAKAANMWVWEAEALGVLRELYGGA